MIPRMQNVLEKIVGQKWTEIEAARRERPPEALRERLSDAPPVRDFAAALAAAPRMGLIAEVKKASPSAGVIRADFDPVAIATAYAAHGAHCISVLTDEQFFQGRLEYLSAIRQAGSLPVLRKDFILDPYQIVEARVFGADAVLLIAECLDDAQLSALYASTRELGMHALIEIYEPENLERVLRLHPSLLGINNRNLKTFATDLEHSVRLAKRIPRETLLVSESGIRNRDDVQRLRESGVRAILVGETLMRAEDLGAKIEELIGLPAPAEGDRG